MHTNDLMLFNSYELGAIRDALAAYAKQYPRGRWQPVYRGAAMRHLISLMPSRTEGIWGDLDWRTKHRVLRAAIVTANDEDENMALADVVKHLTAIVDARVARDSEHDTY